MLLQITGSLSELALWIALIAAIGGPAISWGSMVAAKKSTDVSILELKNRLDEHDRIIANMNKDYTAVSNQLTKQNTILEEVIAPTIRELKADLKRHAERAENLMKAIIQLQSNDKKEPS